MSFEGSTGTCKLQLHYIEWEHASTRKGMPMIHTKILKTHLQCNKVGEISLRLNKVFHFLVNKLTVRIIVLWQIVAEVIWYNVQLVEYVIKFLVAKLKPQFVKFQTLCFEEIGHCKPSLFLRAGCVLKWIVYVFILVFSLLKGFFEMQ